MMKAFLMIIVVSMFLGLVAADAEGVVNLSTLGRSSTDTIGIPSTSSSASNIAVTMLGEKTVPEVLDLSTLGKKTVESTTPPVMITGPSPITFTPMFAIQNQNVTTVAGTVFTLPQAISSNATVYTPPIAIFGGS
jgi:hypothetical protein